MITIDEIEEFAINFKPNNYSYEERMRLLGIAISIRTDIHKSFKLKE